MAKQIVAAAPGGTGIQYADFEGKLFVVEPLEVEHLVTQFSEGKEQEAVRANVFVLVAKDKTEEFEDTLIFPRVLISQTKRQIGSYVVGRLTKGEAKRGQSAPWKFAEPSPADLKKAADFLSKHSISAAGADDEDDYDDEGDDAF